MTIHQFNKPDARKSAVETLKRKILDGIHPYSDKVLKNDPEKEKLIMNNVKYD